MGFKNQGQSLVNDGGDVFALGICRKRWKLELFNIFFHIFVNNIVMSGFVTSKSLWRLVRVIFVWPCKMVSVSPRYLFCQPMDAKIKAWTLRFPAKENPNIEKTLFDWPVVLQYDVKAKYRLISRKFSGMTFFHPSVRLTNQKPSAFVSVW